MHDMQDLLCLLRVCVCVAPSRVKQAHRPAALNEERNAASNVTCLLCFKRSDLTVSSWCYTQLLKG